MKKVPSRCGSFSKSNTCVLTFAALACLPSLSVFGESLTNNSEVNGNFTVGTTTTKGKLTVNAPQSVTSDLTVLGLQVSSAGGVFFGASSLGENLSYVPSVNSGFYFCAFDTAIQLGNFFVGANGWASISSGYYSKASGSESIAIGYQVQATGYTSAAFGNQSLASGTTSAAFGYLTDATGSNSFSAGDYSLASGVSSFAAGTGVTANSLSSAVFGAFNKVPTASATAWVDADPLFTIGNGTADNQRSSALMVQKDGIVNLYPFGSTSASIVLNPKGTPSITVGGQKVVTSTAAGNVGIGTTSPATNLDIASTSETSALRLRGTTPAAEIADMYVGSAGNLIISTTAGTDADRYIDLRSADDNYGLILRNSSGESDGPWANFYMKDAAVDYLNIVVGQQSWAPGLVVTVDNKVGIGTLTPQNKLDVGSGTGQVYASINGGTSGNAGGAALRVQNGGTDIGAIGNASALNGGSYNSNLMVGSYGSLWFITNGFAGGPKMVLDTSGRLGIGTTTPAQSLSIGSNSGGGSGVAAPVSIGLGSTFGNLSRGKNFKLKLFEATGVGANYDYGLGISDSMFEMTVGTGGDFAFFANANTPNELVRFKNNGNVGIGTSSPSAKLEVSGTVKFTKQGDIPMGEFGTNGD